MKTKEKNNQDLTEKKSYEKPMIEVIEMEHEGSILAGSGSDFGNGGGYNG